jgi:hypothetical protein
MRIGETIATYDVGLALRGKSGRFEVTSPTGEIYEVTCKLSQSSSNLEWSGNGIDNVPFLIRKVADVALPAEPTATTRIQEPENQTPSSPQPFVVERAGDEGSSPHGSNFDLLFLEDDPGTGQPSACIYLKSEPRGRGVEAEKLITARCATLNELDSEIRRLEAQLDEIRSRAKKMFYKTLAIAASA